MCGAPLPHNPRYPDRICTSCVQRAVDEAGRPLKFFNTSISGGFGAAYADTNEPRDSHVCFIDGNRCHADEAYFGGIVVRPTQNA